MFDGARAPTRSAFRSSCDISYPLGSPEKKYCLCFSIPSQIYSVSLACTFQLDGTLACLPGNFRIAVCTLPQTMPLSSSLSENTRSRAETRW